MIRFSPAPGLSLALVPVLAILIALGVWQVRRLAWKTELLAQIEYGETLAPVPLTTLLKAEKRGKIIAWRKVLVRGRIADEPVRFLYSIKGGKPALRAMAAFITDGGILIVVDFGYVATAQKPDYRLPQSGRPVTLHGVMKPVRKPGRFAPQNQPGGLWYWPDTATLLSPFFASPAVETYILDLDVPRAFPDWPEPAPAHAEIANNHLDYALTWFGLALAAFGVYLGWHVRTGRLSLAGKRG